MPFTYIENLIPAMMIEYPAVVAMMFLLIHLLGSKVKPDVFERARMIRVSAAKVIYPVQICLA